MELHLNQMTNKELAEWFGISAATFYNQKAQYLDKLSYYCDFTIAPKGHGVIIHSIDQPVYDKKYKDNIDILFLKEIKENPISSIAGISRKYPDHSSYAYRQSRDNTCGARHMGELEAQGFMGERKKVLAIKLSDTNDYRALTPEEHDILKVILDAYRPTEEDLIRSHINQKDNVVDNGNFYNDVILKFKAKTNLQLVIVDEYTLYAWTPSTYGTDLVARGNKYREAIL